MDPCEFPGNERGDRDFYNNAVFVHEGLYLAMGFSGHGLKLSPGIGEAVAAMVLERPAPIDISALCYERFAQNDLMHLAYGPSARA